MGVFLKVAICDDVQQILEIVEKQIVKIAVKNEIEIDLSLFQSGIELLNSTTRYDICFLDIDLPEIDGFEVAKKLKKDYQTEVVFFTGHKEMIQQSFQYRPFAYLYKPVEPSDLEEVLIRFIHESKEKEANKFLVKTTDGEIPIYYSEIFYLEVFGNETKVHTQKGVFVTKKSLKKWLDELKDKKEFFQCHQSYVVNFEYVSKIENQSIILENQTIVPISFRRRKKVCTAFQLYICQSQID